MTTEVDMLAALGGLGVAWTLTEHAAVFTVEESAQLHQDIAGAHTKNLFLKDAGGQFWLVTAPHEARVDLKALPVVIGSRKLSFGKAYDMERLLGIAPGSVTPLAAYNDSQCAVQVVLDSRLTGQACVNVHPLRNTATLGVSSLGLLTALAAWGHRAIVVDLPAPQ